MASNLYKDHIKDHYKNPRNEGTLDSPTNRSFVSNRSCGDEISLQLEVKDEQVTGIAHQVSGCAICIASMSMLSEKVKDGSLEDIENLKPEDVLQMLGMEPTSGRVNCALLSLNALQEAIKV